MRSILSSYITVMVLLVLIALSGFLLWNKMQDAHEVQKAVREFEEELARFEENNRAVREDIASFEKEDTIEKEARERLNLKRKGEHVVIILPSDAGTVEALPSDEEILALYRKRIEKPERSESAVPEPEHFMLKNLKAWMGLFVE